MKSIRRTVVDVGANVGDFAIEVAIKNPEHLVIAIEPNPTLVEIIETRIRQNNLQNVVVYPCAIGRIEGHQTLYISSEGDFGTTSLRKFDRKNIEDNEYWKTRTDLTHNQSISVEVRTLRSVLQELEIEEVDFLKIDTQGNDLESLMSLGPIKALAGMLESPSSPKDALYLDEPALRETLECLQENGYLLEKIKPNDPACAEVNVYFSLSGTNYSDTVQGLNLAGIFLYDGKEYWWNPTSVPNNEVETSLHNLQSNSARLELRVAELEEEVNIGFSRIQDLTNSLNHIKLSKVWKFTHGITRAFDYFRGLR